jgi:putative protease
MSGEKKLIGKITHYFDKIGVAVIELSDSLHVGQEISIEGAHTNFTQVVDSMQVEHKSIHEAKAGQSVGMKVTDRVHINDQVFRVAPK